MIADGTEEPFIPPADGYGVEIPEVEGDDLTCGEGLGNVST